MSTLGWLHLTDLHRGMSFQGCLWPNVEQQFFTDLETLHAKCGPWHILFFSGDLVQKGSPSEYRKFDDTLARLYKKMNSLGSNPVLVSVPGNHDLVRPSVDDPALKRLAHWHDDDALANEFWTDGKSTARVLLKKALRDYVKWEARHPFPRPTSVRKGLLPGDYAATIECSGLSIGVLGLNSTFLQLAAGDYEGRLALSAEQVAAACGENFTDWFDQHTCCFLMTHHPPTWLDPTSKDVLAAEIAAPNRFIAHLCGHMHELKSITQSIGGAPNQRLWQGASLFGLEVYQDKYERSHGYAVGQLDIGGEVGRLRLWPRLAQKHQAGHWHFIRDPSTTLQADEGTSPEDCLVRSAPVKTSTQNRLFRVLLLFTDEDLKTARHAVADHLQKSLGIEVSQSSQGATSGYGLVVLIQSWWWNGGAASRVWNEVEPDRRVAFLTDEQADWPPHRFVEVEAYKDIVKFRSNLNLAHKFSGPEQLPELVGAVVTERLQQYAGVEASGLRTWERNYLEFRIPAWRSGRTALSQPHLFDAADARELYQPDLYIPLDGTSLNWHRGKDNRPARDPARPKRAEAVVDLTRRLRLTKWTTVPDLRRIALIGAPGGGKTIFLTRIAAAIASACLGRPIELEPDLEVERLRSQTVLPIPIVLEATRIAQRDPAQITALLEAIADETASAGTEAPQATEIEAGLKSGRYLLLIDALDEIADSKKRARTLQLLKGVAGLYPLVRFVLTTRSARYTGSLRFGPELQSVQVAPLDEAQVKQLCSNWSRHRQRDQEYSNLLTAAVSGLADTVERASEDQALTENPLMLTAICMVFERYRSLPDDRGRLCELLIDDLCRSRRSEDIEQNWKLDEAGKKDLLQRIALAMQEQGAQTWGIERAVEIALQLVPKTEASPRDRAKRYVDWAADHTGVLRFQDVSGEEEQIRFWHRLFREYLCACRLAQEDTTAGDKIIKLWNQGRLLDPFWEDVVRLLPRTLGTIEKARSSREQLELLAQQHPQQRGRLLGLAAAGIIENRDLYPDVDTRELASSLAAAYESEAESWSVSDRVLFLEAMGRLDKNDGDPRLGLDRWVEIKGNAAFVVHHGVPPKDTVLAFGWSPVTVQEFFRFVKSPDFEEESFWRSRPSRTPEGDLADLSSRVERQMRHPNRPVVNIGLFEAIAYCHWRTVRLAGKKIIRLPVQSEMTKFYNTPTAKNLLLILGNVERKAPPDLDKAPCNLRVSGLNHPSPVGAFPLRIFGACDILGNVWEFQLPSKSPDGVRTEVPDASFPVGGGAYDSLNFTNAYPPDDLSINGYLSIGFRCVVSAPGLDMDQYLKEIVEMPFRQKRRSSK